MSHEPQHELKKTNQNGQPAGEEAAQVGCLEQDGCLEQEESGCRIPETACRIQETACRIQCIIGERDRLACTRSAPAKGQLDIGCFLRVLGPRVWLRR